jgi:DNA polymerase-3 subunit epsilon
VVDVEATGSSSRRHRIVELAVVLLDGECRLQGEFSTLVDPGGPVGPTHIHGIEPHHVIPAPRFNRIAPRLLGLLRGRVLVGHNVGCDRAFLTAEYARMGVELPQVPELCTMRLAERCFPSSPHGLSLRSCAAAAGLPSWVAHTALGDARAGAQLLARCAPAAEGELAEARAVRWPRMARTSGDDAAWIGRHSLEKGSLRNCRETPPGPATSGTAPRCVVESSEYAQYEADPPPCDPPHQPPRADPTGVSRQFLRAGSRRAGSRASAVASASHVAEGSDPTRRIATIVGNGDA